MDANHYFINLCVSGHIFNVILFIYFVGTFSKINRVMSQSNSDLLSDEDKYLMNVMLNE